MIFVFTVTLSHVISTFARGNSPDLCALEMGTRHLVGMLHRGCSLKLLVYAERKVLRRTLMVFLHFCTAVPVNVAYAYFELETGLFHGLEIYLPYRGQRLTKPIFKFYVELCASIRKFLPSGQKEDYGLETLKNSKPLLAKLYADAGYVPTWRTYPFLLLPQREKDQMQRVIVLDRGNAIIANGDNPKWSFSKSLLASQGITVCDDFDMGVRREMQGVLLWGKTAWRLEDLERRDNALGVVQASVQIEPRGVMILLRERSTPSVRG